MSLINFTYDLANATSKTLIRTTAAAITNGQSWVLNYTVPSNKKAVLNVNFYGERIFFGYSSSTWQYTLDKVFTVPVLIDGAQGDVFMFNIYHQTSGGIYYIVINATKNGSAIFTTISDGASPFYGGQVGQMKCDLSGWITELPL